MTKRDRKRQARRRQASRPRHATPTGETRVVTGSRPRSTASRTRLVDGVPFQVSELVVEVDGRERVLVEPAELHDLVDAGVYEPRALRLEDVRHAIDHYAPLAANPGPVIGLIDLIDDALSEGFAQSVNGVVQLDSDVIDDWAESNDVALDMTNELLFDVTLPLHPGVHFHWHLDPFELDELLADLDELAKYSGSYNGRTFHHPS